MGTPCTTDKEYPPLLHQPILPKPILIMLFPLLSTAVLCSLTAGAPQYGGVQPSNPGKTAPLTGSVQCRTEYTTLWDTEYKETECSTQYKEDCEYQWEGYGNDKVWAPIAGTCKKNPYDECKDVTKTKEKQVAYPVCNDVPEQKCVDVPRQECVTVPDQICTNQPLQKCQDVPRQNCQAVHKKVPVRISRQVPKKVCQDGHSGVFNAVPAVIKGGADVRTGILFEKQINNGAEDENTIVFSN